jgi:hypothetical protein
MVLASHVGNTERLVSETVLPKFRHFVWPRMTEHEEIRAHVMLSFTLTLKEANRLCFFGDLMLIQENSWHLKLERHDSEHGELGMRI